MRTFEHEFSVQAPLAKVAAFHEDGQALRKLTPPPLIIQIHTAEPLGENSRADFTMWLGPLPVRWVAEHVQVNLPLEFTDRQRRGPFRSWSHHHRLLEVDGETTRVVDHITAEPGNLLSRLMWLGLPLLFAYRAWATRRAVGA